MMVDMTMVHLMIMMKIIFEIMIMMNVIKNLNEIIINPSLTVSKTVPCNVKGSLSSL